MSHFGKYHLLVAAALIAGACWLNHSSLPVAFSKDSSDSRKAVAFANTVQSLNTKAAPVTNTTAAFEPAMTAATSNTHFTARLERQVSYIAMMLSRPDVALPAEASKADHFTAEEIRQLGAAAIDSTQKHSVRRASVYLLSKAGAKAIPALGMITTTNFSESAQATEAPLRVTALESLDRLTENSKEVLPVLEKTIEVQKNKSLAFLASISAGGIRNGKPGKLSRAIEMMIQEKTASKDNGL